MNFVTLFQLYSNAKAKCNVLLKIYLMFKYISDNITQKKERFSFHILSFAYFPNKKNTKWKLVLMLRYFLFMKLFSNFGLDLVKFME